MPRPVRAKAYLQRCELMLLLLESVVGLRRYTQGVAFAFLQSLRFVQASKDDKPWADGLLLFQSAQDCLYRAYPYIS